MNRRNTLALTLGLCSGIALLLGNGTVFAQQSETDKVKAAIDGFHAALDSLDIRKMEEVWAHDPFVMMVNPRDKSLSIGWDSVKKNWEATFNFWTELKTPRTDGPHIHISGNVAWVNGMVVANGKPKTGAGVSAPTFETVIFEKRGDRWLIVSHSAWRTPQ